MSFTGNRQVGKSQNAGYAGYAGQTKRDESLKAELGGVRTMDAGQTRRVSASVGEIQELYSALHQLVPGPSRCKLSVPVPGSKLTKSNSMATSKANMIRPRLDMDRKLTSPETMSSYKLTVGQRSQSQTMLNVLSSSPGTRRRQFRRASLDDLLQQRSDEAMDVLDGPSKDPMPIIRRKSVKGAVKCLEENKHNRTAKRASLVDAITILARDPDNVQRLLKEHAQANGDSSESSQEMNNNDSRKKRGPSYRKDSLLDDQMQQLLKSISELQSTDVLDPSMNDEEVLRTLDRKGSCGTEMKNLLQTLNELNSSSGKNSAIASPAPSSVDQSRRGSELDCSKAPRETLDELEAFFSEKLRESTLKDKQQAVSPRRMVKQASVESRDSDISIPLSQTSSSRKESIESDNISDGTAGEQCDNSVAPQMPLDKPVQEKFAQQVCERLEKWLQKATALSEQEKESLRARAGYRKRSSRKRAKRHSESNDKNYSLASTETKPAHSSTPTENIKPTNKPTYLQPQSSGMKKSRSLHNLIFGDDTHFKINFLHKFKSPKSGRHKKSKASKSENNAAMKLDRRRSRSLHDVPRRSQHTETSTEGIPENEAHGCTSPGRFPKSKLVPSTSGPSRLNSQSCDNLTSSKSCENLVSLHKQTFRESSSDSFGSGESHRGSGSGQCLAARSHLPTDLPLFYTPDSSKATFLQMSHKANEPNTQNVHKETPLMRKQLFPHTERLKIYKRNVFYEESREQDKSKNKGLYSTSHNMSLVNPRQPRLNDVAKHPGPSHHIHNKTDEAVKTYDEVFATGHAYDSDEMMDLRLGAKHSESDNDSGCASTEHLNKVCGPGTSETSVQTDPVIVLAEGPYSL